MLIQSVVSRALKSLCNVSAEGKADLCYKFIMFVNLVKKLKILAGDTSSLVAWPFRESIAEVRFDGLKYIFCLARGQDFNVYLNPYFHEYDVTKFVSRSLSLRDVFLDVGAHAGLYTLIAGRRVGPLGKVLSFEPNPVNLFFLRQNIGLNALSNVVIVPKAVSDKTDRIMIYFSPHETALTSALRREGKRISIEVETTTIDNFADVFGLAFVKIMKVDTEGYDLNVLRGASNTLGITQYAVVEQNTNEVRRLLKEKGFRLSTSNPSGYLLAMNTNLER